MQKIEIPPGKTTLGVTLDPVAGLLEFAGVSYPSNPKTFFEPIIDWTNEYLQVRKCSEVNIVFRVTYFNTSSSVYLFKILELFDDAASKGVKTNVECYYFQEQDDALESFKWLFSELDINYRLLKIK